MFSIALRESLLYVGNHVLTFISTPNRAVKCARHDDSTSNLVWHANKECPSLNENEKNNQLMVAQFARGSTYTPEKLRLAFVKWFAVKGRPMAIIEDEPLREILAMLHVGVDIKSADTASRDIKDVFRISQAFVKEKLSVSPLVLLHCIY
jgi:hypothetical protein